MAVGYFNGGKILDLAVVGQNAYAVSVLRGDGTGNFQQAQILNVGIFPVSVAVGDFNGDGIQDLAVANADFNEPNFNSSSISVLLGSGNGFQPARTFALGYTPWSVAVGDFNGDGKPDLAVANRGGDIFYSPVTVSVVLGIGDGSFAATPKVVGVGANPSSVAVRDFNGDKIPDLAVADAGSNTVTVLKGKGDGTFTTVQTLTVGNNPAAVAAGDFNGDGIQDLAVANYGCGGGYYDCLAPGLAPGPTTPSTTVTVLFVRRKAQIFPPTSKSPKT